MAQFVMLTRVSSDAARSPKDLEKLERQVMDRIRKDCPDVKWIGSYAVLGPYDYVDIFEADGIESASKVSTVIRTSGHAHTEVWAATGWDRFKELVRDL